MVDFILRLVMKILQLLEVFSCKCLLMSLWDYHEEAQSYPGFKQLTSLLARSVLVQVKFRDEGSVGVDERSCSI